MEATTRYRNITKVKQETVRSPTTMDAANSPLLVPFIKTEIVTRYRLSDPITFTTDLIAKERTQYTEKKPVSRTTTYLFGVFPIAETVQYNNDRPYTTTTAYHTKETPEMLAAKQAIAAKLQDKKVVLATRVTGRPTTTSGAKIRLIVNELRDQYIINYHVV